MRVERCPQQQGIRVASLVRPKINAVDSGDHAEGIQDLGNPIYAEVRKLLHIASNGDQDTYWTLRRDLYDALLAEERGAAYKSYLDHYAERLVNFGAAYVTALRPDLPNIARHEISAADAFICWAYYLATLGVEATWSVLWLLRQNAVHIGFGVTRFLFEYLTKLEYYAEHRDEARLAFASIAARMVFHARNYGNLSNVMLEEMRMHRDLWKESEPASSFKTLLTFSSTLSTVAPQLAKRLMTECYEMQSGFIHGGGHTMTDILQAETMADSFYNPDKSLSDVCLNLLCILDVLRRSFPSIYGDDDYLDRWFAKYADLVGNNIYLKSEPEG